MATPEIVDRGRGPQLANSRITVLDLVQHFRAGRTYAEIRHIMPSLSDEDIAAVEAHYRADQAAWDQQDREVDAYREEQIRKQHERFPPFQGTHEELLAHLRELIKRRSAEKNGVHPAR